MRLFLDTMAVIYSVEDIPGLGPLVDARLAGSGVEPVSSELAWMECRVRPLRLANAKLLLEFEDFFAQVLSETIVLSRAVLEKAAEIRAQWNFKTPDAIQLAAAMVSQCDLFLTNDAKLAKFAGITVEKIQP